MQYLAFRHLSPSFIFCQILFSIQKVLTISVEAIVIVVEERGKLGQKCISILASDGGGHRRSVPTAAWFRQENNTV